MWVTYILLHYVYFNTGATLSAVPAGVLYAQTGPQPSPVAGFSLVTQPIHYPTASLNAAVKTSSAEQTVTAGQVTGDQQTQQQQQQTQPQAQQQQQTAQQASANEIQTVQNIAFAAGNTFPTGSYAGVIPAQAYGNAYLTQQPGVAGKNMAIWMYFLCISIPNIHIKLGLFGMQHFRYQYTCNTIPMLSVYQRECQREKENPST